MKTSRRDFLKGASGLALLPLLLQRDSDILTRGAHNTRPLYWDRVFYHACGVCDSVCGTKVYVRDGRISWIEGNPADSLGGRGKVCGKGVSAMRSLYDPDRLKAPLKRTNPRKGKNDDPGWVKISWDEAFSTIGERFNQAIRDHGPESVLLISRPQSADVRLQKAIGTPNLINHVDTCYSTHQGAWIAASGKGRPWALDLDNAKYILSFGWDMPGKSKMCYLNAFVAAKDKGAKVVVFDPQMSITAAKADEWFPIKPGTDLAVILAMMNVIISEGLYDKDYVDKYTFGFDRLAEHVKQYTPEWAAQISDVPAEDIIRIARELATTKPAIVPTHKRDAGGPNYTNSFQTAFAQICLSALIGSIERPGGIYWPRQPKVRSVDQFAPVEYPSIKEKRRVDERQRLPFGNRINHGSFSTFANGLLKAVEQGDPYPIKAALAKNYSILSFPEPDILVEALAKLDFFAVVDILPGEMAQLADIVLPDLHFLEREGVEIRTYQALWPEVELREGIGPLWEEKGWGSIVNGILDAMGKSEFKVDWKGLEKAQLEDIGIDVEYLRNHDGIWQMPQVPSGEPTFSTPSKKLELYSSTLENEGYEALPTWHGKLTQPTSQYPFHLLVTRTAWFRHGKLTNDPVILELQPENFLHIHPDAAARIGVAEGDYVIVESPTGKPLRIKAHLTRGIRTDCVMTEHGYGHWSKGLRNAYGHGTNEGDLVPAQTMDDHLQRKSYDPVVNGRMSDVCVSVRRA